MQTGNTDFIYTNELDEAFFQHDMAYGKTKDLAERTQSDNVLKDKARKIASDPKYDGYQMNFINQLLENLKKEKFMHLLETIFGVLI